MTEITKEVTDTINQNTESTDITESVTDTMENTENTETETPKVSEPGVTGYLYDQFNRASQYVPDVSSISNLTSQDLTNGVYNTAYGIAGFTKRTAISGYNATFGQCFMPFNQLSQILAEEVYGTPPSPREMESLENPNPVTESPVTEPPVTEPPVNETPGTAEAESQTETSGPSLIQHVADQ